jgi:hypothetical protein
MGKLYVKPEDLIVTARDAQYVSTVAKYYSFFKQGAKNIEPTVVVCKKHRDFGSLLEYMGVGESEALEDDALQDFLENLSQYANSTTFYCVERFHRAIGATLAMDRIPCFDLKSERSLALFKKRIENREIRDVDVEGNTLVDVATGLEGYYLGCTDGAVVNAHEIAECIVMRAEESHFSDDELPEKIARDWRSRHDSAF